MRPSDSERNSTMAPTVATRRPATRVSSRPVTARGLRRACQAGRPRVPALSLLHLLREVVRFADLLDELELSLEPVGVLFLGYEDLGHHVLGGVVVRLARDVDALVQEGDRRVLELEVA